MLVDGVGASGSKKHQGVLVEDISFSDFFYGFFSNGDEEWKITDGI